MRSGNPVSDPPWMRKPHGSPPSRITWRSGGCWVPLLLLLIVPSAAIGFHLLLQQQNNQMKHYNSLEIQI